MFYVLCVAGDCAAAMCTLLRIVVVRGTFFFCVHPAQVIWHYNFRLLFFFSEKSSSWCKKSNCTGLVGLVIHILGKLSAAWLWRFRAVPLGGDGGFVLGGGGDFSWVNLSCTLAEESSWYSDRGLRKDFHLHCMGKKRRESARSSASLLRDWCSFFDGSHRCLQFCCVFGKQFLFRDCCGFKGSNPEWKSKVVVIEIVETLYVFNALLAARLRSQMLPGAGAIFEELI